MTHSPVYVIHGQPLFWDGMRELGGVWAERYSASFAIFVASLMAFGGSVICDLPRRVVLLVTGALKRRLTALAEHFDELEESYEEK